jgi:hypothetical protein
MWSKNTKHDLLILLRYWGLGFIIITVVLTLMGVKTGNALMISGGWCLCTGLMMWWFRSIGIPDGKE